MKLILTFFTITLMYAFFSGCVPRDKQAKLENTPDDRADAAEEIKVEQPVEDNIEGAEAYIGKHLLVGLAYRNNKEEVIRRVQLHGKITRITEEGIFFDRADGKGEFSLPPDLESFEPAIPWC